MRHIMNLHHDPFCRILTGEKVVESRLYDEKRQAIRVGDTIEFVSRDTTERCVAIVEELVRKEHFHTLLSSFPIEAFGEESVADGLAHLRRYYTEENEKANGVIGIRFRLLAAEIHGR